METFSLLLIVGTQGLYTRGWRKSSTLASPKSQLSSSPPVRSSRTAANRWRVRQSTIKSCFPWKTSATKPSKTTPLPIMEELNAPPTLDMLSCGKASDSNGIPPEIVKAGKENSLLGHLLGLLLQCWHERTLPQDMRDVEIITLCKKKRATTVIAKTIAECPSKHVGQGIRTGCPQPLPTTPWSSLLKVLVRISSEKVNNQYGFLLQAATREILRTETLAVPHIHWLDQGIWPGQSYRTLPASAHDWMSPPPPPPPKLLKVIMSFRHGMMCTVQFDGSSSDPFPIKSGVKQGCVLALTLFGIFFSLLLPYLFHESEDGIFVHTRSNDNLFNLWHLRAKTKVHRVLTREMLFADDAALATYSQEALQRLISCFTNACRVLPHHQPEVNQYHGPTCRHHPNNHHPLTDPGSCWQIHLPWLHNLQQPAHWTQSWTSG